MNGMPYARRSMYWRQQMVPCIAYVSQVSVIDQRVHVDCYDPETGQQWQRLPLMVFGGGAESSLAIPPVAYPRETVQQPEEEDGAQVLVVPRLKQGPVAFSCSQHPLSGYQDVEDLEEVEKTANNDQDHPLPTTVTEHIWRHAGVRVQLTGDGSCVIDVTKSEKPVRIQLPDDGTLRVSRNGSAGGRLTLWHKLVQWLDEDAEWVPAGAEADAPTLLDWVINVLARLSYLEANVDTLRDKLKAPTTGASPSITAAEAELIKSFSDFSGEPNLGWPPRPAMGAAALDVSTDAEG